MKLQQFIQSYYVHRIKALGHFSKKKAARYAFDIFCWPFTRVNYKPTEFLQQAEQLELAFEGLKTKGYRWNTGGAKKIYIAHGFRSSAVNFSHFAKRFIAKGYEVVAFDAPGHGLSEGNRITGIIYKRFIEAINKNYGPFDGYVTHSFGGLGAAFAVADMPENSTIKIALIAPASDTRSLSEIFFKEMKIRDAKVQRYFLEEIEKLGQNSIEWFSIKRCMNSIKGDVLWVHDKTDKVTPVEDAYVVERERFPNIRYIFTDGLGHRKIYRDEKVVQLVNEFL